MSNKLEGITWHAQGEANFYRLMRGNHWVAIVQLNGEMLVWDQEQLLNAMLQGQQAAPVGEPDCDRSACGDFSPGPCDNPDCPALRSNKAAPVGEPDDDRTAIHQLAFELGGTEGGEYLLDLDDLNAVIDAAHQRQSGVMESNASILEFAVSRWEAEVKHRPLVNVHRRSLDGTWRQVIRFAGGDPDALCGHCHDELIARLNGGSSHE